MSKFMSAEEAGNVLMKEVPNFYANADDKVCEAVDLAIKALERAEDCHNVSEDRFAFDFVCDKCGAKVFNENLKVGEKTIGASFCPNCGRKITEAENE